MSIQCTRTVHSRAECLCEFVDGLYVTDRLDMQSNSRRPVLLWTFGLAQNPSPSVALHAQPVCDKQTVSKAEALCPRVHYPRILHRQWCFMLYILCVSKNAPTAYWRGVDKICSILKLTDNAEAAEEQFNTYSHCVGVHTIVLQVNWWCNRVKLHP